MRKLMRRGKANEMNHTNWEYRLLTGVEAMAMAGWCFTLWPIAEPEPDHELLVSLAGNAFSLFAFGPLWIGLLSSLSVPAPQLATLGGDSDIEVVDSDGNVSE